MKAAPAILLALAVGPAAAQSAPWQPGRLATRLSDIAPALSQCWTPPPVLGGVRPEVTVRVALRADGSLLGEPRVSYVAAPPGSTARDLLAASAIRAVRRCTPVALEPGLGAAIAGRIISLRFIHQGQSGRGV